MKPLVLASNAQFGACAGGKGLGRSATACGRRPLFLWRPILVCALGHMRLRMKPVLGGGFSLSGQSSLL